MASPVRLMVHGDVLFLPGPHDPNQYWLPLPGFAFISPVDEFVEPVSKHTHEGSLPRLNKRVASKYAHIEAGSRRPYMPRKGVPQAILPFREWRRLSSKQNQNMASAEYPAFERGADGNLLTLRFVPGTYVEHDLYAFLDENCTGRYHVKQQHRTQNSCVFESYRDFVRAKLTFETF